MTAIFARALQRRTLLKTLLAFPALTVFRHAQTEMPGDSDAVVEIDGWILKRRDLA